MIMTFPTFIFGMDAIADEFALSWYDQARHDAPAAKPRRPDDRGPLSWELPKADDTSFQRRCHDAVVAMCGGRL